MLPGSGVGTVGVDFVGLPRAVDDDQLVATAASEHPFVRVGQSRLKAVRLPRGVLAGKGCF